MVGTTLEPMVAISNEDDLTDVPCLDVSKKHRIPGQGPVIDTHQDDGQAEASRRNGHGKSMLVKHEEPCKLSDAVIVDGMVKPVTSTKTERNGQGPLASDGRSFTPVTEDNLVNTASGLGPRQNHRCIEGTSSFKPPSEIWIQEKSRYLAMRPEEKRRHYACGDDYVTLEEVPTWGDYAEANSLGGNAASTSDDFNNLVSIWVGDITRLEADVLVNAANRTLLGGGGVDGAVHKAAGSELRDECATLNGCETGEVKTTGGYRLPAKYIMHTVGPTTEEQELLCQCYWNCLMSMKAMGQRTIAFPCISTGAYGFPRGMAAELAIEVVRKFLEVNRSAVDRIVFCIFQSEDITLYEQTMMKFFPVNVDLVCESDQQGSVVDTQDAVSRQLLDSSDDQGPTDLPAEGDESSEVVKVELYPTSSGVSPEVVARREVPDWAGVYIEGAIQGEEVVFTVDSGATSTILAHKVYLRIPVARRPELELSPGCRSPATADGRSMEHFGSAVFQLELGSLVMDKQITVANIQDEVLLGADVIQWDPSGPADILLTQNMMILNNVAIPLQQVGAPSRVRKVRCADHHVVPPLSEMMVDVFVDRGVSDVSDELLFVEPDADIAMKYSVVVAPCIVDISRRCTVQVRVLNPTWNNVSLKQDMILGMAEAVAEPPVLLLENEHEMEVGNWSSVRRIGQGPTDISTTSPSHISPTTEVDHLNVPEHLKLTLEEASEICTSPEQKAQLASLLCKYSHAFSVDDHDLGLTNITQHVIETGDARPIKQPPRRVPMAFTGEDKGAIEKLWKQGSIRPSTSPWASPIVLVRKKDGQVRTCVDYRRLNSVTVKDAFPIPRVQDCLDTVAGAVLFSTMDITAAYNQIPVRQEDIPKTAFCSRYGLMEFVTMPFGLATATATFQRAMEIALVGLQWTSCLIYLDDVVVFGNNFEEHLRRLDLVLERIARAGLKLKPKKCHLFQEEVTFLGHVVSKRGVLPNPDNVVKMVNWPVPSTPTHVRSFLGMAQYYRRFVKNFSDVARPLTDLTKKGVTFKWTEACQTAFSTLKDTLLSPEVMAYPQNDGLFILDTDASLVAIGAVLSQVQKKVERVVAYGSRTLGKAERNYCTTDRELLAVKYFMEYYKHYLLGRRFLVRTDHQPLRYLHSLKEPKDRTARWIESMSAFDFGIEYRPGKKHGNADAMSRCPVPLDCQCPDALDIENLRCGPCTKCRKRAEVMCSDLRPTSEFIENQSKLATNGSEVVSRELRVRSTHNHAA